MQPRREPNLMYRVSRMVYPFLKHIYTNMGISSSDLALLMYHTGMKGSNRTLYENRDIRTLARMAGVY